MSAMLFLFKLISVSYSPKLLKIQVFLMFDFKRYLSMKKVAPLFSLLFASAFVFGQDQSASSGGNQVVNAAPAAENNASARHQAVLNLKIALSETLNLISTDNTLTKSEVSAEIFARYLNELDKSFAQKKQVLIEEGKSYSVNYLERSVLNNFYSKSKSLECLNQTNNKDFARFKDIDGENIVAYPVETLKSNTRYGMVDNFKQGFARIKKDQVYGFLNQCGEEVIPAQFEYAEPFNDGKALVKKFIWYFIDAEGNESGELEGVIEAKALKYGISLVKLKNNKFTLINNDYDDTKKFLSPQFDQIEAFNLGDNLFRVRNGKLFGIMRINGMSVVDVQYDKIEPSESEEWVAVEKNKKIGLLTTEGAVKVPVNYDEIISVIVNKTISKSTSPIFVRDLSGYKLLELSKEKVSAIYSTVTPFNSLGLSKVCNSKSGKLKCGYIDYDGIEVIPSQYDDLTEFTKYGLVVGRNRFENCSIPNGPCIADVILDKTGKIIVDKSSPNLPVSIKYAITDTLFNKRLILVKTNFATNDKGENVGFKLIDKLDFNVLTPTSINQVRRFNDDLISVMVDDKWGVLDYTGKFLVKPNYKEVLHESEGLFGVKFDNNKLGFIDKKGKVQITFEYTDINPFKNGLAIVSKLGKFGIITKFNAKIAPCVFKEINPMPGGNFELVDTGNTKYVLNSNGDCQTNCSKFDEIRKKANN